MFELSSGQYGHPYVQQEVCVIERTMRQEPLGANLLNFGLQGQGLKSVRGDVGNSLLALVPGSQHQVRSGYQPSAGPRSTFMSSNPQAYQMNSSSSGAGSWPVHLSTISAGNRIGGGGTAHGTDSSFNMLGREVNLSMLGREVNLAQYSRGAGQDCFESNLMRTTGFETLRQNVVHDNGNDMSGQGPFPQWLTEIVSRRQRVQNMQSPPLFPSGGSFARGADSSRDVGTGMGALPSSSSTTRGNRVICTNYDTGQRIGGELYLTQLGLLGVLCSCHASHMPVSKFTQHVGIYSTNPGNLVVMDGSGESLVEWRRMFFSQYGVKVPEDNQGWDWTEGEVCENGPPKYKAVVTQSWKKELDVTYDGEPVLKSRVTQVWDASLSPATTANFHATQVTNMGLQSNLSDGSLDDSRESFLRSFGRAFRGNPVDFGSCAPSFENLQQTTPRSQGLVDLHQRRSSSQLGATPSGEFFNFISRSQQFVSGHTEQQVAVERQMSVGSRSLSKGLDLTWNDGGEPLQQEKDNSLSSFELRLGQPSQQTQPAGPISSTLATQMQRVLERVLDTSRQQNTQSPNTAALHTFSANQEPSNERQLNQHHQSFERMTYMEPNRLNSVRAESNRGMEGSGSMLVDQFSFKRAEDASSSRLAAMVRDRDHMLSRDTGQFSTDGVRRWPGAGSVGRSCVGGEGVLINSDHSSKQWDSGVPPQLSGGMWSLSQGQQELDTILGHEWMPKNRPPQQQTPQLSDTMEGRENQAYRGQNMVLNQGDCTPVSRGSLQDMRHDESHVINRAEVTEVAPQVWGRASDPQSRGSEHTSVKSDSAVAVSSGVSDKRQPVSAVCSKSSENVLSGFSDGTGAEEEVSNAQSTDKHAVRSEVVDEGSGIGKCSSSDGVDMGLAPNLKMSSKDDHAEKDASPSSQGYASVSYAEEDAATVGTRSRRGYTMKEPFTRQTEEDCIVDRGKVERKRRRAMKWKRLDAAIDAADSKRLKPSTPPNMVEMDAPQRELQQSDSSNGMGNKNVAVEFCPSTCAVVKPRKIVLVHGNRAAHSAGRAVEDKLGNDMDSVDIDEKCPQNPENVVIRLAQNFNGKKAKRSGRSKLDRRRVTPGYRKETTTNAFSPSEMVHVAPQETVNMEVCVLDNSSVKESGVTRSSIPESAVVSTMTLPRKSPWLSVPSIKLGRVLLGRPSPRGATRMVSLNDIMSKPPNLPAAVPTDDVETVVVDGSSTHMAPPSKEGSKGSSKAVALEDGSRASALKECSKAPLSKEGSKASGTADEDCSRALTVKEGSKAPPSKEGLKASASMLGLQASSVKVVLKASLPKGGHKASVLKERTKTSADQVELRDSVCTSVANPPVCRDGSNSSALKDSWKLPVTVGSLKAPPKALPEGSKGSRLCKATVLKNGLKAVAVKERLKISISKETPNGSVPLPIVNASASDTPTLKDGLISPVTMYSLRAPSRVMAEGNGPKKTDSHLSIVAISQDNQDKEAPVAVKTGKESCKEHKLHKHEVRKIRSIYELTSEKKLPGPGVGVFEFHDEVMNPPPVLKQDSIVRLPMQVEKAFSVPVHYSDSKCFVPRGERSPRGKPSKIKNLCWHKGKDGHVGLSKFAAEPVEIVVDETFLPSLEHRPDSRIATEKEALADTESCPVRSRIRLPKMKKSKFGINDASLPRASSMVEEVFSEDEMGDMRLRQHKRVFEQLHVSESISKKAKLSGLAEPSSCILRVNHHLPVATPSAPCPLSSCMAEAPDMKDMKTKRHGVDEDLKSAGKKKRCQRPKFDCRVPEGVVGCCVCGSSISEFVNQIVCCERCPVKVHQACYGVKKIPNRAWLCHTCKATAANPICVLCGYGGGAMTRARKATGFVKGLVKAWQDKVNLKEKVEVIRPHSLLGQGGHFCHGGTTHQKVAEKHENSEFCSSVSQEEKGVTNRPQIDANSGSHLSSLGENEKPILDGDLIVGNTVRTGVADPTAVQWVHMVCALWMPGTRCLNFATMGVFDVSQVAQTRRKLICSICNSKGGACIQCRVAKCGTPFHAWCAHEKGLLQSEVVEDGSDQVGFFGKCVRHGKGGDLLDVSADLTNIVPEGPGSAIGTGTSARTEGYKGRLTLEQRAINRRQATRNGSAAVSPEQVAAWLRINERKTCKARRVPKSMVSDQKTDHREYLRFKQEQGWRRLAVYKSGIHALGLYTSEFIGRGEMVVEYIGEIVGLRVADKREADYHSGKRLQYQGACYLFRIDRERIIDATRKGGIARFVNHSCSPNCVAKVICVKNQSKVVFFAQRDIYAGEEITYDYQFNFEQEGDKIPCFCGSANCRGTLN